jgi:hypothetical protein
MALRNKVGKALLLLHLASPQLASSSPHTPCASLVRIVADSIPPDRWLDASAAKDYIDIHKQIVNCDLPCQINTEKFSGIIRAYGNDIQIEIFRFSEDTLSSVTTSAKYFKINSAVFGAASELMRKHKSFENLIVISNKTKGAELEKNFSHLGFEQSRRLFDVVRGHKNFKVIIPRLAIEQIVPAHEWSWNDR